MARRRNNALVAFLGGMGAGYLQNEREKKVSERQDKQDERQAKMDQIVLDRAEREKAQAEKADAVNAEVAAVPTESYSDKRAMTNDDVRGMMGGSATEGDANYISDDAAQRYIKNNTGAKQVGSNAAYFASQGINQGLGGRKPVDTADGVQLADPESAKKVPLYRRLEQQAQVRINSGDPQQEQLGYAALAHATTLKSKALADGLAKAKTKGLEGMMAFVSEWDTDDLPATNLRMEQPAGGKGVHTLFGTVDGEERVIRRYDTSKLPEGVTLEDYVYRDAQALLDPKTMFENARNDLTMRREDARNKVTDDRNKAVDDRAQESHDLDVTSKKTANQYQAQVIQAGLERDRAAADSSRASAAKARAGDDGENLKPPTAAERTKSSEIQGARAKIGRLTKEDRAFLDSGDIGMNAQVSPRQKLLQEMQAKAMDVDPVAVKTYGTDPHRDRFMSGGSPYKHTPLIPDPAKRQAGQIYELPDGKVAKWDGKGLVPVK